MRNFRIMEVTVDDKDAWDALIAQLQKHGGMQVQVAPEELPEPFATIEVVFLIDDSPFVEAEGRVVHIGDHGEVSLMFEADARQELLDATPQSGPAAGPIDDRPLWIRYDEMTKPEKMKLARQGNVDARRLVMKDRDPSLQVHLLKNPGLSGNEAAQLVKSGGANTSFLQRLASRSDLMSSPRLVEALVTSPSTPIPLALSLVGKLPIDVCRRIAKSNSYRMPILQAARKRVIR